MDKLETIETMVEDSNTIFYEAFSFLPEKKKHAVFAVYAYYEHAQSAIEKDGDLEKLQTIKKQLKDTFDGQVPKDPIFEGLYDAIMAFPTSITPYMELLDALRDDHYDKPLENDQDLDEYIIKAGGSLGLMLVPILAPKGYKDNLKKLKALGLEFGKAFELTKILRNVRDDLTNHRIYFSKEIIEQHKVKIPTLRTGIVTPEYRSMMEHYIEKAKEKYHNFYEHIELLDSDSIYPSYLAASMYEGILAEIRKGDYANITKKYSLGKLKKYLLRKKIKSELKKRGIEVT